MPPKRNKSNKTKNSTIIKKRLKKESKNKIKDKGNDKAEYLCGVCNQNFQNSTELNNHGQTCKNDLLSVALAPQNNYKCNECSKVFKFKKNFMLHCKNEHSNASTSLSCTLCKARCPNMKMLTEHYKHAHYKSEFECPSCGKTFVRRSHVFRHMSQSGCDGSTVTLYPCEICDATFSRKDNLIVHLRLQHILKKSFACKHCQYTTRSHSKLIKHWQETHINITDIHMELAGPQKYECDICGKSTSSRNAIAKHLEIHGPKKHACDKCGYKTFTAEVLKRHTLTHVSDKPHKCQVCGQSYIQRLQLQRHMEKHTGNICSTCGRNFSSKVRLIIHERVHQGLNKLECPFEDCPLSKKEFASETNLQSHVKTHLTSKGFKCEVCGKGFHSEMNMKRHVATHRLDRPRRCMYCVAARAYIRGEQLLRHVRHQHPDLFRQHLHHVRTVLGTDVNVDRVKKSELESILNVLDAESDRIIEGYGGSDVLYGGIQEQEKENPTTGTSKEAPVNKEDNPLMSEEELEENLILLLSKLIDDETLECFGWPKEAVDIVLERVVEQCGGRGADRSRWSRVQCLRENSKQLFLHCVDDKLVARMLDTHTIDQIIKHILLQVDD